MYLLDTVTLSEPSKPDANPKVIEWLQSQPPHQLFTSVICLGEIERGIARLPAGGKRVRLEKWLKEDVNDWFSDRVLPLDTDTARLWGQITANPRETAPVADSLIAATAIQHSLRVVTRNIRHFAAIEADTFDPWAA
jgi:toxin FitB